MGSYRVLDEIALSDCAVDISARTLNDAFETAARALAELTVDPATVTASISRRIALEAPGLEELLFDWLSELIYLKDRDGEVFVQSDVQVSGDGPYRLAAGLRGGRIVPGSTTRRADVKGVTLHQFTLEPCEGGWHARIVFDL